MPLNNIELLKQNFTYCDIPVNFAGLIGSTRGMVRGGWELNLNALRSEYRESLTVFFVGVHRYLNLKIISARLELFYNVTSGNELNDVFRYMRDCPVRISACAENLILPIMGEHKVVSSSWNGTFGYEDPISMQRRNFDDVFHFPSNNTLITIREDKIWTIEEHLKAIRDAQEPMQDEILKGGNLELKTQTKLQLVGIA